MLSAVAAPSWGNESVGGVSNWARRSLFKLPHRQLRQELAAKLESKKNPSKPLTPPVLAVTRQFAP
jgi:hypothetical protein